jgi:hypothetical protein
MTKRLTIISIAIAIFTLVPLFQNCSPPKKFVSTDSNKASMGGGEGYGGKLYNLVSAADPCADPSLPQSKLSVMSQSEVYLISQSCQSLVNPPRVNVVFAANPDVAYFNGQSFREENSTAPFDPVVIEQVFFIEAENITNVPYNARPTSRNVLNFNSDGFAYQDVTFATAGMHRLTLRADGWLLNMTGLPQMEITLDGVSLGVVNVATKPAEYFFETNVTAGTHSIGIGYINDQNTDGDPDRDLGVDWLRITR